MLTVHRDAVSVSIHHATHYTTHARITKGGKFPLLRVIQPLKINAHPQIRADFLNVALARRLCLTIDRVAIVPLVERSSFPSTDKSSCSSINIRFIFGIHTIRSRNPAEPLPVCLVLLVTYRSQLNIKFFLCALQHTGFPSNFRKITNYKMHVMVSFYH